MDEKRNTIICGEVLATLKEFPDNCIDSIVTDPPYELAFMGKKWDISGIAFNVVFWKELLRVAKPGAMLLSFGGTRTYHRLTCAIEDAGWEIRDCLMWIYGQGFPKSLDISKAIEKAARGCPQGTADPLSPQHGQYKGGCTYDDPKGQSFGAGASQWLRKEYKSTYGINKRRKELGYRPNDVKPGVDLAPMTELGMQWEGWGTALKPAYEIVIAAQKPLDLALYNEITYNLGEIVCHSLINIQKQDISKSQEMTSIHLSTVLLWLNILEENSKNGNKFTTSIVSKMITELKTLNCLLSMNMQRNTDTEYQTSQNGIVKYRADRVEVSCQNCGRVFRRKKPEAERHPEHYCSRACYIQTKRKWYAFQMRKQIYYQSS